MTRVSRYGSRARFATLLAIGALGMLGLAPTADAGMAVESKLVPTGAGEAGGEIAVVRDIAIDEATGQIYLAEGTGNRIQRLAADGSFELAWGRDAVSPGGAGNVPGGDERQRIAVTAAGLAAGAFSFEVRLPGTAGAFVENLPVNATANALRLALEGTAPISPGDVVVTGAAGGPWTLEFTGAWADTDIPRTFAFSGTSGPKAGVTTLANGGGPMEVCTVASQCKQGGTGDAFDGPGGEFSDPHGVALAPNGHLFVTDSANARVQEFSFDENGTPADPSDDLPVFERAWGRDAVRSGEAGDIAASETQTITVSGATGGQFALRFEHLAERRFDFSIPIAHDASAAAILSALEEGASIEPGDVSVAGPAGGPWTVDFGTGAYAGRDVPQIEVSTLVVPSPLAGPDPSVGVVSSDGSGFEVCEQAADCQAAAYGAQPGEFGFATGGRLRLAVDPTSGEVFVADAQNRRISRFDPDAPVPADVFVQSYGGPGSGPGQFAGTQPEFVAFDPAGILYASDDNGNRVQRLNPDSDFLAPIAQQPGGPLLEGQETAGLEADPLSGNLLVWRDPPSGEAVIQEIDPTLDEEVDRHLSGAGFGGLLDGLAVNAAAGTMYIVAGSFGTGDPGPGGLYLLDADGSPPALATMTPPGGGDVGARTATFNGTVNPNGTIYTSYRFEYSVDGNTWLPVPDGNVDVGTGTSPIPVQQPVSNLEPNTSYLVRLATVKAYGNGTKATAPETFTTLAAPPTVSGVSAISVGNTAARLIGRVDPESSSTTYRFEYGTDSSYGSSVPVPAGDAGAGPSKVFVAAPISGLAPDTIYHYRLVAENAAGVTESEDRTLRTRTAPRPSSERGYEMVTPPYKEGGRGVGEYRTSADDPDAPVAPGVASIAGDRYISASFLGGVLVEGKAIYATDYALSERTPQGWRSASPWTRSDYSEAGGFDAFFEPYASSPDLSLIGWHVNGQSALLFPEMEAWDPKTLPNYLGTWDGRWELLAPRQPDQGAIPDGRQIGMGVSADSTHAYAEAQFRGLLGARDASLDQLPGGAGGHTPYAYDVSAGVSDTFPGTADASLLAACTGQVGVDRTQIPLRLGSGKQSAQDCQAAAAGRDVRLVSNRGAAVRRANPAQNAISADGKRIFFTSPDPEASGVPASCSGTGLGTSCPPQLFVRVEGGPGEFATRWVSRSEVANQDASLMARVVYEGASTDGDKVFFRTDSPLTADDPNGACGAPCLTGTPDPNSWDLFMFDFTDSEGDDPGDGDLVRISAGPGADGDPNVSSGGSGGALRFASDDGDRVYFVSASPIPGVSTNSAPGNGTSTTAGGTPSSTTTANLYLYDDGLPAADRWQFIALLPKSTGTAIAGCATHYWREGQAKKDMDPNSGGVQPTNCVRGTADGSFVTFWTDGSLEPDDEESPTGIAATGDIYAFDADADRLTRLSAPHGSNVGGYVCWSKGGGNPQQRCFADPGFSGDAFNGKDVQISPLLGVATAPADPGERIAFFQSRARLVPEDLNDQYDVYEWRDGDLNLLSAGTSGNGSYYGGNGASGRDVFIHTKDRLTWEDLDGEMDVYDARIGGGFPEPESAPCDVLADRCQGHPTPQPRSEGEIGSSGIEGRGNVRTPARGRRAGANRCQRIAKRSRAAQNRAARLSRRAQRAGDEARPDLLRRAAELRRQAAKEKREAGKCKQRARSGR